MKRFALGAFCAVAILGILAPVAMAVPGTTDDEYVVGVTGMQWGVSCVKKVRATLTKLDDVTGVTVDFKAATATVKTKGSLDKATVTSALKKSGFGVSSFAKNGPPKTYVLAVTGMTWGVSCVKRVRATLTGLKGVKAVKIDFKAATATVSMKKQASLTKKVVVKALAPNYGVTSITEQTATKPVYSLVVSGMTWGFSCVKSVRAALVKIENVDKVDIDFKSKTAKVTMKGSAKLAQKTVASALPKRYGVTSFEKI